MFSLFMAKMALLWASSTYPCEFNQCFDEEIHIKEKEGEPFSSLIDY